MTINPTQFFRQRAGPCHVVNREAINVKLFAPKSHHLLDCDYDNDNDNRSPAMRDH